MIDKPHINDIDGPVAYVDGSFKEETNDAAIIPEESVEENRQNIQKSDNKKKNVSK